MPAVRSRATGEPGRVAGHLEVDPPGAVETERAGRIVLTLGELIAHGVLSCGGDERSRSALEVGVSGPASHHSNKRTASVISPLRGMFHFRDRSSILRRSSVLIVT